MSVNKRFEKLLKPIATNQRQIAEVLGVSQKTVSYAISKDRKDNLFTGLAKYYPNLNFHWLLLGEGNMWKDILEKKESISDKNAADDNQEPSTATTSNFQDHLRQEFNEQIRIIADAKNKEIKRLEEIIAAKDEMLSMKDEMIQMLKQQSK